MFFDEYKIVCWDCQLSIILLICHKLFLPNFEYSFILLSLSSVLKIQCMNQSHELLLQLLSFDIQLHLRNWVVLRLHRSSLRFSEILLWIKEIPFDWFLSFLLWSPFRSQQRTSPSFEWAISWVALGQLWTSKALLLKLLQFVY